MYPELTEHLLQFVTENKRDLFAKVVKERTRHVTVMIENVFQSHNASAVLRSCDCFGIQDVHIVENNNEYQINPDVALGASKWLSLHRYNSAENNTDACIKALKDNGYKVLATTPHTEDQKLSEVSLDEPLAFMFGTELEGLSETAMEQADGFVRIPMHGFTESYNISVSAALTLYDVTQRLRASNVDWGLGPDEEAEVIHGWARQVVKRSDLIEQEFLSKTKGS